MRLRDYLRLLRPRYGFAVCDATGKRLAVLRQRLWTHRAAVMFIPIARHIADLQHGERLEIIVID